MHILLPETDNCLLESAEEKEGPQKIFHEYLVEISSMHPTEPLRLLFYYLWFCLKLLDESQKVDCLIA